MGMPNLTDNYQGYNEGDLSKHVDQLKDKQFLLVSFCVKWALGLLKYLTMTDRPISININMIINVQE